MKGLFRNTITSDDRHVISQFLLDAEKEMRDWQAEINRLRSAMHRLENRRNGLKKTMERCRSLLSPVHRLPAEVLALIFSFCSEAPGLVRPSCCPVALQVVRVCGRWRDVGLGTPSLWSSIGIAFQDWRDKAKSLIALTQLFMERSKQSPLDLWIEFGTEDAAESDPGHESGHPFMPVIAALSRNCGRWRSLTIRIPRPFAQHARLFFSGVQEQSFPCLQELRLLGATPGVGASNSALGFPDNLLGFFTHCPSLHILNVSARFLTHRLALPLHQIRTLSIQTSYFPPALAFVALQPRLENLMLSAVGGNPDAQAYNGHIISDTIRKLSAVLEGQKDVTTLSHLTLPALTSLTMEAAPVKWKVWDESPVTDLVARSGCSLTSLSIKWIPMTDRQLIHLLEQTPTLSSLHIEEVPGKTANAIVTGPFLRRLVVDHEDVILQCGRSLLPSLTDLTVVIRAPGLVEQEIFDAVSSRQILDPLDVKEFGVKCLKSISIIVMGGDAAEYSMSSLECFRDTGLRLRIGHKPLILGA
ncbi:hypothetical protein PM082_010411 [Marasmius tenuissimus]|nr:hypothetical protein PM082_010411 [Marasmius tenuissimus]